MQDLLDLTPGGLREEQIAYVCREALEALAGLHAKGLVHRDVKPGNIFVTSAGGVKLGDLGAARRAADACPGDWTAGPLWAAPEVLAARPYGPPADGQDCMGHGRSTAVPTTGCAKGSPSEPRTAVRGQKKDEAEKAPKLAGRVPLDLAMAERAAGRKPEEGKRQAHLLVNELGVPAIEFV